MDLSEQVKEFRVLKKTNRIRVADLLCKLSLPQIHIHKTTFSLRGSTQISCKSGSNCLVTQISDTYNHLSSKREIRLLGSLPVERKK